MDCPHSPANRSAPPAILEEDKREEEMKPGHEQLKDAIGKEDLEMLKEPYQGLENLCWSLRAVEQAVYLSLPAWIQGALLCNLVAPLGLAGIHNSFPARLLSYMLLPYMLPATIFIFASHSVFVRAWRWVSLPFRILWRLSKLPECALCLWRSLRQTVPNAINVASSCLHGLRVPVPCAIDPSVLAEQEHSDQTNLVGQRSLLHMQLSTPGLHTPVHPITDTISYSFLFNLALGVGGQPNTPLLPNTRPILLEVEFNSDVEVEAEIMGNGGQPGYGTSPRVSFLELENVYDERGTTADEGEEKP
ncbi:uncharacterized protein [Paramormyrops kingsleyae]|uniref:uncharacterized protein isoform X1 n=1 Tax=Paramormyrops kingsleyae TaxID=1676925 RepID=UPI000CD65FCF|nr:uncharacterized protein LOC111837562 isoform X1 [Paramormyrops kingsleyae]